MIGKRGKWSTYFVVIIYHIHESNIYGERQCRGKL